MFVDFERYAGERGIEVLLSVMSTAGGINVGPGAFALSYIAGPPITLPSTAGNSADTIQQEPALADWVI